MAGNSILVSIIVPVYNVYDYLEESLNSVISQSYKNIEIIIVNDGSTDGSDEICNQYAKKDNRIVAIHQENRGLSAARNTGLDRATGDVIAFLDPDDAYQPNAIQIMLQEMNKQNADIVVCEFSIHRTLEHMRCHMYSSKKTYDTHTKVIQKNDAFQMIINGRIDSAPWNRIYNKYIWEDLRFPDGYVYEGTFTVFDIFDKAERIVVLEKKLIMHRIRPGSISNSLTLKNIQDCEHAREHYNAFIREHVPNIFSDHQYDRICQKQIYGLMGGYAQYIIKKPEDEEGKQIICDMLISVKGNLDRCCFFLKIGYSLILKHPFIAVLLYYPYHIVKNLIKHIRAEQVW